MNTELVFKEIRQRGDYIDVERDLAKLDGKFTAEELRAVLEKLEGKAGAQADNPFQFGLRSLFGLTLTVAIVMALPRPAVLTLGILLILVAYAALGVVAFRSR